MYNSTIIVTRFGLQVCYGSKENAIIEIIVNNNNITLNHDVVSAYAAISITFHMLAAGDQDAS